MSIEGNRLGIVGGGQLGRMQTEAALPMGIDVSVVEKDLDCPAAQAGAKVILGDIKDAEAITKLAQSTDVVTWEIEHINTDILIQLREEHGIDVQPSPHSLKIVQDKHTQKQHFQKAGLPVADFRELDSKAAYEAALREWGRMMIKTRKGGFDGRGNMVVSSQGWRQVQQHFGNAELYAERMVDFEQELAIIVARDRLGNIESYPVVQTTHRDNICHLVEAPAPNLTVKKINEAHEIGRATVETLEGAGVFALELFDTGDSLIINEMAPRVHNSGHWTIEGSKTSQFEQHVRAVMGLPLGPAFMDNFTWKAVMINILGEGKKPDGYRLTAKDLVAAYTAVPEIKVHLYGKGARLARKIGHITIPALFDNPDIVRKKAELARNLIEV